MKKLLPLAIALVAALAGLTSCSNDTEEVLAEKNENEIENATKYTYDFTFTKEVSETDAESRAVKSAWVDGDKVFVFFQNWTDGYLEFTYSSASSKWALAEKAFSGGSSPNLPAGGRCMGIWVDGNSLDSFEPGSYAYTKATVNFPLKEMLVSNGGTVDYNNGGTVGGVQYTISGNNVSARFTMKQHPCYTKVTATGLTPSNEWWFKIKSATNVAYKPQLEITTNGLTLKVKDMGIKDGYIPGVKEGEDHYFFYNTASFKGKTKERFEVFNIRYADPEMFNFKKSYYIAMGDYVGEAIKIKCASSDVDSDWTDGWKDLNWTLE